MDLVFVMNNLAVLIFLKVIVHNWIVF